MTRRQSTVERTDDTVPGATTDAAPGETTDRTATETTRRSFLAGVGTLGVAGWSGLGRASTGPTTRPDGGGRSDVAALERIVDDAVGRRVGTTTPGAAVAVVSRDGPLFTRGYGTADADTGAPVRPDETVFRVGSVGKLLTYTAVLRGVERGLVDLDTDVNRYLDDSAVTVPATYDEPVTLRHLGTHTAGFASALNPGVVDDPGAIDPLETVLATERPARVRPPGEFVGYSNYGAALAGHVVAEAAGTTFEEYVQSTVLDPLGMTHSTFAQPIPTDHPGDRAAAHTADGDAFRTTPDVYLEMLPAGSLSATVTDMATFASAHLGDGAVGDRRVLTSASAELMLDRHHVRHPAVTNWRYGFHEYGDPTADVVAHSGATVDFTSYLLLAPEEDVGIFLVYDSNPAEHPRAVVDEIVRAAGLTPEPATPTPTTESGWRERAATVAGEYALTSFPRRGPLGFVGLLEHLTVDPAGDGRIRTTTADGDDRLWVETEPYVYTETGGRDVLAFEVTDGTVTAANVSSVPTGVYRPVPIHERQLVTGGVLGTALSGFGLSLAGWGGRDLHRRWRRWRTDEETAGETA